MKSNKAVFALALLGASGAAFAHPGHETMSFMAGLSHPPSGADHLLAMLAVGLYAGRQQGAARWALPAGFLSLMVVGALLAQAGVMLPAIEFGIAASVLVLGLLIAALARLPLAATLPLVGAFALCHGAAHYAERGQAGLLAYGAGFLVATAALHGIGFVLARALPANAAGRWIERAAGGLIAVAGALMLGAA
jgi:urease accessory protein